jgi:hypothetical protein
MRIVATKEITVTLDQQQLTRINALVASRTIPYVPGFIQHAVAIALDDVAGWGAMLAEALRQTGGDLTVEERAWLVLSPRLSVSPTDKTAWLDSCVNPPPTSSLSTVSMPQAWADCSPRVAAPTSSMPMWLSAQNAAASRYLPPTQRIYVASIHSSAS